MPGKRRAAAVGAEAAWRPRRAGFDLQAWRSAPEGNPAARCTFTRTPDTHSAFSPYHGGRSRQSSSPCAATRPYTMPANVEIKARVRDLAQLVSNAERLSGSPGCVILQTDTFFPVLHGRLKLRDLQDGHGQLVFYNRPDSKGPKLSHYSISPTDDPTGLAALLSQALGVQGTVKKERHLYLVGQTRVHVDHVEGLGDFMELEVVLEEQQSAQHGEAVARRLMEELGIKEEDLLTGAYLDLLLAGGEPSHP